MRSIGWRRVVEGPAQPVDAYESSDCPEALLSLSKGRTRPKGVVESKGGVQFHPELKSKPFQPHPLFASFIEAAVNNLGLFDVLNPTVLSLSKGAAVKQSRLV